MLNKKLVILISIVASLAVLATSYLLLSPKIVSIQDITNQAAPLEVSLSKDWVHPETPESSNENPIGDVSVANSYLNTNKCFIEFENILGLTIENASSDYDSTASVIYRSGGVTVLNSVTSGSLVAVPFVGKNEKLEMLLSRNAIFASFLYNSSEYNVVTLSRHSLEGDTFFQIIIGCPKGSNFNPEDIVPEISIAEMK
jgi:hypothetical protein